MEKICGYLYENKKHFREGEYVELMKMIKNECEDQKRKRTCLNESIKKNAELYDLLQERFHRNSYLEHTISKLFKRITKISEQLESLKSVKGVGEKIHTSILEHMT